MLDREHFLEWQERHLDILILLASYFDCPYEEFLHLFYRGYNERYITWITDNFSHLILLYQNCFAGLDYTLAKFLSLAYRSSVRESVIGSYNICR